MKRIITFVLCIALLCTACFSLTSCFGTVKDVDYIKEKGKLIVGITDYAPMDYKEEGSDEWIGFDADMARKLGQKLGVEVEFVGIDWGKKTTELQTKNIDVIWNGMTATDELDEVIDFSVSYAENKQVAVIKKSNASRINSEATVKAASIVVEDSSAGHTVATEVLKAANVTPLAQGGQSKALAEVLAGTSEVAIIDYTMAYSLVGKGQYADLQMVDPDTVSFGREVFAVGIRERSDLADVLNELFKDCYADGTMATLAEAYKGVALNDEALGALK